MSDPVKLSSETGPDLFKDLLNQLIISEKAITKSFPEVAWDFTELKGHIASLGQMLGQGQVQSARVAHQSFSVAAPGRLLASKRKPTPAYVIKEWARAGGRVKSARKAAAVRQNLIKARMAKAQKAAAGAARTKAAADPILERAAHRMRELRAHLRRLRQNELRAKNDFWITWRSYNMRRWIAEHILLRFEARYPTLARAKWKKPYARDSIRHWLEGDRWKRAWLFKVRALVKYRLLETHPPELVAKILERVDSLIENSELSSEEKKSYLTNIMVEFQEGTWVTSYCSKQKAAIPVLRALRRATEAEATEPKSVKYLARMVARHVHSLIFTCSEHDPTIWSDHARQRELVQKIASLLYDHAYGASGEEEKTAARLFEIARVTNDRLAKAPSQPMEHGAIAPATHPRQDGSL